jgi:thiol-disulfide isomerase/thioredoxin
MGFFARIGGVLVAPRKTLGRMVAAGESRGGRDVALLLVLRVVAGELPRLVRALMRGVDLGLLAGLQSLSRTTAEVLPDVLGILAAGVALSLLGGRRETAEGQKRIDAFDLAAYAWVPYLAATVTLGIAFMVTRRPPTPAMRLAGEGIALGWAAAVWLCALLALRRAPEAPPPPRREEKVAGAGLLGVLGLLFAFQAVVVARNWDALKTVTTRPGSAAPRFSLPLHAGGTFRLDEARPRPLVLAFWATWCGPCRKELPALDRLAVDLGGAADFLAVDIEGAASRPAVARFVDEVGLKLPVALDGGAVADQYHVESIPHVVVLDRDTRVAAVFAGPVAPSTIGRVVRQLERKPD